jgi:hypothetical protein
MGAGTGRTSRRRVCAKSAARLAGEGQQTKMELVYQYLTGPRFRHRIEDRERKTMMRCGRSVKSRFAASWNPRPGCTATCKGLLAAACWRSTGWSYRCSMGQRLTLQNDGVDAVLVLFFLVLHRALPDLQRMKPGRGSVCGTVGASESPEKGDNPSSRIAIGKGACYETSVAPG